MSDAGSLSFLLSEGTRPVVVYDSCILYPAPVRDIFIELAATGVIRSHWSSLIHEEWTRNVIADKRGSKRDIERTRALMDLAIPAAITTGFEHSITRFSLPDPTDSHVLALAVFIGAHFITTFNLKDFPHNILKKHQIRAIHPDTFLATLFDYQPEALRDSTQNILRRLKNPSVSLEEYTKILEKHQLNRTAECLRG